MSKRSDIIDGKQAKNRKYGLVYTKKCGWVDLGHANPESAEKLLNQFIVGELRNRSEEEYFDVSYKQTMKKGIFGCTISDGAEKYFKVKKGVRNQQKKSIALSIFLEVSYSFENLQNSWPYSLTTDSGYSAEDLMSNLIGFYRAVEPNVNILQSCEPVSKDVALRIWDVYGPVGKNKNYSVVPFLYPVNEYQGIGPMCGVIPEFLNTIKPFVLGKPDFYYETKPERRLFNTDCNGMQTEVRSIEGCFKSPYSLRRCFGIPY